MVLPSSYASRIDAPPLAAPLLFLLFVPFMRVFLFMPFMRVVLFMPFMRVVLFMRLHLPFMRLFFMRLHLFVIDAPRSSSTSACAFGLKLITATAMRASVSSASSDASAASK